MTRDMAHRQPHAHRAEVAGHPVELLLFVAGILATLLVLSLVPVP